MMASNDTARKNDSNNLSTEQALRDRIKRVAGGTGISLSGGLLGRGIKFASQIFMARLLGPAGYGLYSVGRNALDLLSSLSQMGLGEGAIRYLSQNSGNEELPSIRGILLQALAGSLILGSILAACLFTFAPSLVRVIYAKDQLAPIFRIFAFGIVLASSTRVLSKATRASKKMQYYVYVNDFIAPVSELILFGALFLLGWNVYGAALATNLSYAIALSCVIYFLVRIFPEQLLFETEIQYGANLVSFSIPVGLAIFFNLSVFTSDILILGAYQPSAEVGVYQAAARLSRVFLIFLAASNSIFTPIIAELYEQDKISELDELYKISTKWILYLSIPFYVLMLFSGADLLHLLFGETYRDGLLSLLVLSTAQMVNIGTGAVGFMLIMTDNQRLQLLNTIVIAATNLFLNFLLIPLYGHHGAAVATAFSVSTIYLLALFQVKWILSVVPFDDRAYKLGFILLTCIGVAYLTNNFIHAQLSPLHSMLTLGAAIFVTFYGLIYYLPLGKEDEIVVTSLRKSVFRRE